MIDFDNPVHSVIYNDNQITERGNQTSERIATREAINNDLDIRESGKGKTFAEMLSSSVDQANVHQHQANRAISELVAGRNKNIHETMLAIERADMSLKLVMQVRNKILDAYKEIMRMQV